jgi:lipoprotein-anchoring transpeptidase ErfK/SrfK
MQPFLMRSAFVLISTLSMYSPSLGQDYYRSQAPLSQRTAPARSSDLGGGLIEFLVEGSAPAPSRGWTNGRAGQPNAYYSTPQPRAEQAYAANPPQAGLQRERDTRFQKQLVSYGRKEALGTIIVDTPHHFLYLVTGDGQALRYGIGVGRPGFEWSGVKQVSRKAEWPDWTPPPEMLLRRPDLPRHMAGGPDNPLGARALYLGSSMYRIHGTNEPETIGQNVSSGCIRMMNADVIDLYNRTRVGARVVVI